MIETTMSSLRLNEPQTSHLNALGDQTRLVREDDQARETRSVENTGGSAEPKMNLNTETKTETDIVDNVVVTEKYDSKGNLVNVVPPGHVPLSSRF